MTKSQAMSKNLTGKLLIASPYLSDGNFLRSVLLIVTHSSSGAFGVMLNRCTSRRLRDLIELSSASGTAMREDDQIYLGGPCEGPLLAIHDLAGIGSPCLAVDAGDGDAGKIADEVSGPAPAADMPSPTLWISCEDDQLRILHRRGEASVRYVISYSGWGPGQLDAELGQGGWLVCDADADLVFGDADDVWEAAVRRCGHQVLTDMVPGLRVCDPELN